MKQIIWKLVALFMGVLCSLASAQETGELLRFEGKVNLDIQLSARLVARAGDSVLFTSQESEPAREPFDRILVNGLLSDTNVVLQLRYLDEKGGWTQWETVYLRVFPNGRFWARYDLPEGETRQIQYRIINRGVRPPIRIEIYAVEGINRKQEGRLPERERRPPSQKAFFMVQDTVPKPPIISRQQWGADPPVGNYIPHNPYRLTQHHTAGRRVSTLEEGIQEMQFIQDFHQNGRGWQDIGYHFCVDDSGRLYEGVPVEYRGTHVGGNNTGNIGISYMGNFQIAGEYPTEEAFRSLVNIWSWLSDAYTINPDSLFGHRDYKATACPGDNLYVRLPVMRNEIRKTLGFGAPYVAFPFPQPFSAEVDPGTAISFSIRDDEEGVDRQTIRVWVNHEQVVPSISGTATEYRIHYQPPEPFPYSQNVVVEVQAGDLGEPARTMSYRYQFRIEVETFYAEVEDADSMRNADLYVVGDWQLDLNDVQLEGLNDGARLVALDQDSSHVARIYPRVSEPGDYRVYFATASRYLGESARFTFVNALGRRMVHFTEYNRVFYQKWGRLSPTPIYFTGVPRNGGFIELSGLGAFDVRLVLDAIRLEKVDRLDAPHAPVLKWVKPVVPGSREIEISWYPTLEGDIAGYRLYASPDGLTWGDPIVDEQVLTADDRVYRLVYPDTGTTVYFRVVAVDTNKFVGEDGTAEPFVSLPSDAYGVGFFSGPRVLIVDNFDRRASWQKPYHPFVASYGEALAANGVGFESCTETAVQNGEIDLNDYDVVIYFCGDDSRSDESLAAADQFRLLDYLENGGKLFISGSEIGYDFAGTTAVEKDRYEYLLRAQYVGDLSGSNRVLGENGTVFEGLDFEYGTVNGPDLYIEDYPDYLKPIHGSRTALVYDNLRIAGIQFTGTYGQSPREAQLVYLGFTFETIVTPTDRAQLMGRVLNYFGYVTSIEGTDAGVPRRLALLPNFPNPFNPATTIEYRIPARLTGAEVQLEIFNILGEQVRTLVRRRRTAGVYRVQWDGRDDRGIPVASGVYIYRLKVKDRRLSRKMMLLR